MRNKLLGRKSNCWFSLKQLVLENQTVLGASKFRPEGCRLKSNSVFDRFAASSTPMIMSAWIKRKEKMSSDTFSYGVIKECRTVSFTRSRSCWHCVWIFCSQFAECTMIKTGWRISHFSSLTPVFFLVCYQIKSLYYGLTGNMPNKDEFTLFLSYTK